MDPIAPTSPESAGDSFSQMERKINAMHMMLIGNGNPGLKTLVDRNTQYIEGDRWFKRKVGGTLIAIVLTTLATLAISVAAIIQIQGLKIIP